MLIHSDYRNDENYYPKTLQIFHKILLYCRYFCSNSDEKYYDEECIHLILEPLKK